jgi:hypothetical protein
MRPLLSNEAVSGGAMITDTPAELGRDDRIRTCDPLTPSQVRYQAAPRPGHALSGAYTA